MSATTCLGWDNHFHCQIPLTRVQNLGYFVLDIEGPDKKDVVLKIYKETIEMLNTAQDWNDIDKLNKCLALNTSYNLKIRPFLGNKECQLISRRNFLKSKMFSIELSMKSFSQCRELEQEVNKYFYIQNVIDKFIAKSVAGQNLLKKIHAISRQLELNIQASLRPVTKVD